MVLDDNGLRLVHLGDLGHVLDPETVAAIGRVDVLLVPVGGTYTIGAPAADEVVRSLSPRLVVPMHFSNDRCTMPISGVDEFLLLQEQVVRTGSSTMEITSESLPDELTIAVMDHAR
jgi:L-ascorbate metabolism protein UlaG (beta-lactamase superfamily)